MWDDSQQEVWSASQINDFLRFILFLASMEIAKHDLYISISVFPVLQRKCLDAMFGTRILNFTILALMFSRITYGSQSQLKFQIQMAWYYDVVE